MRRILIIFLLFLSLSPLPASAALVVDVRVEGIDGAMHDNVLQQLSLVREREHPLLDLYRLRRLHQRAEDEIRTALRPFGYYQPKVVATLAEQDGAWLASYAITLGPAVRISALNVTISGEAENDPAFVAWREAFPLQEGGVLDHAAYERAKRDLLQLARDHGYFEAELKRHELEVTLADNSARVTLDLVSGPRYAFGAAQFDEVELDDELLRHYLTFKPGEPYDAERIFQLQRALADSDYFEFIEVRAEPETAAGTPGAPAPASTTVPVKVRLRLKPQTRYTVGVGYGTDTGPRVSAGMERRRVNEHGHRLTIETTVSQIHTTVKGVYRIPLARPTTDFLAFSSGWEREVVDTSTRETLTVGGGLTVQVDQWQRTMALTVQNERYTVADQSDVTTLVLPSIGWQRVEADDRLFPSQGWRLATEIRGASETLGSDASLLQGVLRAKAVNPLGSGRLILRADFGASQTPDFERIPASLRFFAGGDNSIRGYGYKSLGPTNDDGEVIGGRHLMVFSAEYDRYFSRRFGAAVFFDAGNAFNDEEFIPVKGAGAGLRWRLPFGVIRLDVASPVHEDKPEWRLHLTLGPDL